MVGVLIWNLIMLLFSVYLERCLMERDHLDGY